MHIEAEGPAGGRAPIITCWLVRLACPIAGLHSSKIEVEWPGRYYPATVLTTTADGKTRIHYDGYGDEWDEDVGEDRIREPTGAEDPLD